MRKEVAVLSALGIGAGLMYLFDPDRGKRRRALIRDKAESAANKIADTAGKMNRDLRNRAYGLIAETKNFFRHEEVPDDVLVDRVRSKLGRVSRHVGALDVTAHNGVVALRGPVLANEVDHVLRAVRSVRGVKDDIENQLEVHEQSGDIPALQDELADAR